MNGKCKVTSKDKVNKGMWIAKESEQQMNRKGKGQQVTSKSRIVEWTLDTMSALFITSAASLLGRESGWVEPGWVEPSLYSRISPCSGDTEGMAPSRGRDRHILNTPPESVHSRHHNRECHLQKKQKKRTEAIHSRNRKPIYLFLVF